MIWTIFVTYQISKLRALWLKINKVFQALTWSMFFNRPEPLLNSTNISLRQTFWQSYMKIGHEMWLLQCLQGFSFFLPSDLVFDPAWPSFELDRGIIGTNLLTKFHDDQTRNVASRVFTRFLYSQIRKTAPPTGGHVFQRTGTTFELNQHIIKTNIFTKLHEDWGWNVTSTVFTSFFFFFT